MTDATQRAPSGSIVIPACNEAKVIGRLLREIAEPARTGEFEVIVVPNGCTDDTARVARSFAGVRVEELTDGSKSAALNRGDELATVLPRLYLDADMRVSANTIRELFRALDGADPHAPLAGRPRTRIVSNSSSRTVRAYYRARERSLGTEVALWGGGMYGVSAAGRARFTRFPDTHGDDYWINSLFTAQEKVWTPGHVDRFVPRTTKELLKTLRRVHRGNAEINNDETLNTGVGHHSTTKDTARRLLTTTRSPRELFDSTAYIAVTVASRISARLTSNTAWGRDHSSRSA